jgi:hypothetical protein
LQLSVPHAKPQAALFFTRSRLVYDAVTTLTRRP